MRTFRLVMIAAALACDTSVMAGDIAPGGTLRAIYLGSNPAQAMRDPATGEVRGPAYDLARELARRNNVPLEFKPIASRRPSSRRSRTQRPTLALSPMRRRGS